MTREEFLRTLDAKLAGLPADEREDAVKYYSEYLDEAGADNVEDAITELGDIQRIANVIIANSPTYQNGTYNANAAASKKPQPELTLEGPDWTQKKGGADKTQKNIEKTEIPNSAANAAGAAQNADASSARQNKGGAYDYSQNAQQNTGAYDYRQNAQASSNQYTGYDYSQNANANQGAYDYSQNAQTAQGAPKYTPQNSDANTFKLIIFIIFCIILLPVILSILGTLIGFVFTVIGAAIGLLAGGIAAIVVGIFHLTVSLASGLVTLGAGLICLAIGALIGRWVVMLGVKFLPKIISMFGKIIANVKEKAAKYI